ncbi:nuclear transport factor 2B [Fagus crenata]
MNPDEVSKAFVEHYYSTFDSNRVALAKLYQEGSMLTFEGQKIQGSQNIVAKLTTLPFQQCKHNITTVDCYNSLFIFSDKLSSSTLYFIFYSI